MLDVSTQRRSRSRPQYECWLVDPVTVKASQLMQASAQSGVATAQSEAQSDTSHANADFVADSAASPLATHSHGEISTAGAQSFVAQPVASAAGADIRQDAQPERGGFGMLTVRLVL